MIPAFWDASALVPLCVLQQTVTQSRSLALQYDQVVWWATRVEVRSAIERLRRSGNLSQDTHPFALKRLERLTIDWQEIPPSQSLRIQAEELLDQYSLRAADSLQLAAALAWCGGRPQGRVFLSADVRLREAARSAGFDITVIT